MKKILGLALAAAMSLSLVACGGGNNNTPAGSNPANSAPAGSTPAASTPATPAASGELITVGVINNDPNE